MPRQLVKHDFWVFLLGCLWERLAFELAFEQSIIDFTGFDGHHSVRWGLEENKAEEGRTQCLCLCWDIYLLLTLDIGASGSPAFWFKLNYTTGFPGLGDSRSWDFSASIIAWANSYTKSYVIYFCISYWFYFSGELELMYTFHIFPRPYSLALKALHNLPLVCFSNIICCSQLLPCPDTVTILLSYPAQLSCTQLVGSLWYSWKEVYSCKI